MKKFLLAAAIILFAQISQAQAYTPQEGDKAIINHRKCGWCYMSYDEANIYRQKKLIFEDKAPVYGCNNPHTNGEHYWGNSYTVSYYLFTGGNWQKVTDY